MNYKITLIIFLLIQIISYNLFEHFQLNYSNDEFLQK